MEAAAVPEEPAAPPAGEEAAPAEDGWVPWATMGLGAALLGGGGIFGLLAAQEEEARDGLAADAEGRSHRVRYPEYAEHDDAARSRALVANVLYGAGAVAIAAGVILWVAGGDAGEAGVSVRPLVRPGLAGLAVTWGDCP